MNTYLVSGGASGLGGATVRLLVSKGHGVVICDLDEEKGESLAKELGSNAVFASCNVTHEDQVQAAVQKACEMGNLRGAVTCAGIAPPAKVVGRKGPHSLDLFKKVIEVNLIGTFNVLRLVSAAMIDATQPRDSGERGVVITTASIAAFEGQIGQAAYSASKGGVTGMTLPAARELARHGIRVMTIAPGLFNTPLMESLPEEVRETLGKRVPFPSRLGEPREFAELACHIIDNPLMNGSCVRLDGALRMPPK